MLLLLTSRNTQHFVSFAQLEIGFKNNFDRKVENYEHKLFALPPALHHQTYNEIFTKITCSIIL